MTRDFNIHYSLWDPSFPHHSSISNDLLIIADSFNLDLSFLTNHVLTRYLDNKNDSNLVIDLMFFWSGSSKLDSHLIHLDWHLSSDYAPLMITIPIVEKHVNSSKHSIGKYSEEEVSFIKDVSLIFKNLNTFNILDSSSLNKLVNDFAQEIEHTWKKHSKIVNIMKHSKSWWDDKCSCDLKIYRTIRSLDNWKTFWSMVKSTKRMFFNLKIQEIVNKKQGPWELMNWVNKWKLPAIKTIKYNNQLCLEIHDLWHALHSSFNIAQHHIINKRVLEELLLFPSYDWNRFSKEEFIIAITKCNNSSISRPNKLLWSHLKHILKDKMYLKNLVNIVNSCFDLGFWPSYFKISTTIVIPKPNKILYNSPKVFRPIILLNTLGKLIERVIDERLQFHVVSNNFIHQSQLGSLKFKSTLDTGVALTYFIHIGWVKNLSTSSLVFDISQFFPLLNHHHLSLILKKVGFDFYIVQFFSNYLGEKRTHYFWNNFSLPSSNINVGVGQGSALSPILSALYLSPFLHILENQLKNLKIPISFSLFVDNGLLVTQSKYFQLSNSHLFCSYNVASNLLSDFGLVVEHSKTKIFHFSRSIGLFNSPPLDLSAIGGPILCPKETWKYLGFIFDRKLSFHQHINFYSNKSISIVKCMKILGNLVQGLNPHQKHLLYRSFILPITLYGFQLWYYNNAPLAYPLKQLGKIQRRVAIWILGAFKTSLLFRVEAIAGLIPINLHLKKLSRRSQLWAHSLLSNHIFHSLMELRNDSLYHQHLLSFGGLTRCQCTLIKRLVVNMNNRYNEVFSSFNSLYPELLPGNRVIDIFSNHFSFHPVSECKNNLKY